MGNDSKRERINRARGISSNYGFDRIRRSVNSKEKLIEEREKKQEEREKPFKEIQELRLKFNVVLDFSIKSQALQILDKAERALELGGISNDSYQQKIKTVKKMLEKYSIPQSNNKQSGR